jgi:hypothetical protein
MVLYKSSCIMYLIFLWKLRTSKCVYTRPMLARSTSTAMLVLVAVLIWPFDSRTNPASIWIVGSFHHRETKLPRETLAATPSSSSAPSPSHPFPACLRSALSRRPSLISASLSSAGLHIDGEAKRAWGSSTTTPADPSSVSVA